MSISSERLYEIKEEIKMVEEALLAVNDKLTEQYGYMGLRSESAQISCSYLRVNRIKIIGFERCKHKQGLIFEKIIMYKNQSKVLTLDWYMYNYMKDTVKNPQ